MQLTRYDSRLTDAAWELVAPLLPATRARLTVAHNRYARGCQCNLLSAPHGLSMAIASARVPCLGHCLLLFPELGEPGRVDQPAKNIVDVNIAGALHYNVPTPLD
jgi:hypothetical protein